MKLSNLITAVLNVFLKTFLSHFITDLKIRLKTKSCANQINNKNLFIDFLNIQKIITIVNIDLVENLYFYIELKINSIFEKNKKSYIFKSLLLINNNKKSDYLKNSFIKQYLNHAHVPSKKLFNDNLTAMYVDAENVKHDVSLKNFQFIKCNFEKLFQSQFTTLKSLVNYFYVSMLQYKNDLNEIAKQTKKSKTKKS